LAEYLRARPRRWISGPELARVGGLLAFRSRLSDLRRAPWSMEIRNRLRRVEREDGSIAVLSEYMFLPPTAGATNPRQIGLLDLDAGQ